MQALLSSFDVGTHIGFTVVCLVVGATLWLADDFIAERADLDRELPYDFNGVQRPDQDRSDRDAFREKAANTTQYAGKLLLAAGVLLGAGLAARLLL
jgi:hypothetical protein